METPNKDLGVREGAVRHHGEGIEASNDGRGARRNAAR
jgi:hypothetical protein